MNLLLDTHTFIWYVRDDPQLPQSVAEAIEAPENTVYISVVSLWEIAIKSSLGKLALGRRIDDFFTKHVDGNGFQMLGVSRAHLVTFHGLPFYPRDPFDRLLIAQSIAEGMAFATGDREAQKYAINQLW